MVEGRVAAGLRLWRIRNRARSNGEAKDPRRDAPFALFTALLICTVIYALIQWVVVGVLPDAAHSERPLADVARIAVGSLGADLVAVGALISFYGYLSAKILAMPRVTSP